MCSSISTVICLTFSTAQFHVGEVRPLAPLLSTCEGGVEVCGVSDGERPGLAALLVPEKDRGNSSDVTVGSQRYEQVQKQALAMFIHLRVAVVKP